MRPWQRYTLMIVLGLAVGASLAVYRVREGLAAGQVTNGPWATAKTYGTKEADALTRARVALGGLLALPAKEAMYFTARTDSEGRPLDGRCAYRVEFGAFPARWWSITLYDEQGRLRANSQNRYSINERSIFRPPPAPGRRVFDWSFDITENEQLHREIWLPSGGPGRFELTLRLYHPSPALLAAPERVSLPRIVGEGCP